MIERWKCKHGLTLSDRCDACEVEEARETVRRHGEEVDAARRLIERTERESAEAR